MLRVEDPEKTERIPSGLELQKEFDALVVSQSEIVSEAELSYLFGDEAQALAAARDARDSGRDGRDQGRNGNG